MDKIIKKISFISSVYKNNECFGYNYDRDDFIFFIANLKLGLLKYGFDIATDDINIPETSDFIIRFGLETKMYLGPKDKSYLIALESPNFDLPATDFKNHKHFKKIFTNKDDLIDFKKYFKLNYSFRVPKKIPRSFNDKKLCCLIAGNKWSSYPNELYSKRREIIEWFQQHNAQDFDLYGTKWDEYRFGYSLLGRIANKIPVKFKQSKYPSYKGSVKTKFDVLQNYKFSICYENICDCNGYITEKLFDSFFAGCVPVYWGASNVKSHIPSGCFVDKRNFKTYEDLFNYINNISEDEYFGYIDNIERFLNSEDIKQYTADYFCETLAHHLLDDT